jgi:hypothetical protein
MGRRLTIAVGIAALLSLCLAGVARAGISITYPSGPDPAVRSWPAWPWPVSCAGIEFDPVAAFGGPTGAENGAGAPEQALRAFLEAGESPLVPDRFWRLVSLSPEQATFAEGRLAQGPLWLAFRLEGDAWRQSGPPGYCAPRSVREDAEVAAWFLDRRRPQELGPNTRRIRVDLKSHAGCDGGRSLNAAAEPPRFRQYGRRLVMTIWLAPLSPGPHSCPGHSEPPLAVKLPGRLGHRRLFDGVTYPPRPRR